MELHHQKQLTPIQSTKFKSRTKNSGGGNKFVGVRQRPSGRWVAEIKDTTQKIRVWLGTFETADEAARAYDEAACLLRGANTRTNFTATRRPASGAGAGESPLATRIRKLLHHKKLSSDPSLLNPHQNPDFPPSRRRNPAFSPPAETSAASAGGGSPTSSTSTSTAADSSGIFADEFELGPSMGEASWAFDAMFDCFSEIGGGAAAAVAEATEFERMKVERQISASLYAMNGVQEYFEAVQDLSSSFPASSLLYPVWDLPQLLHFYEN